MIDHLRLFLTFGFLLLLSSCGGSSTSGPQTAIIGLALDSYTSPSKLYVTNADKQIIQSVDLASNAVTVFAGATGSSGSSDASGTSARFNEPFAIALVGSDLFIGDTYNHTIRKMTSAGVVTTLAGSSGTAGNVDGAGSTARFYYPKSLAGDTTYLYVADTFNQTIRQITISSGLVTTFAGYAGAVGSIDGVGAAARFNYPFGIALDASGNLFVSDTLNHTLRKITPAGVVSTFAGAVGDAGASDGTGIAAKFNVPAGIATDGSNLFVVDSGNHTLRKITSAGIVTTLAGTAGATGSTDAVGSAARFNNPTALTIDAAGNLYVSDQNYQKVRKVTPAGAVSTLSATF
jgi:hypothetical protein